MFFLHRKGGLKVVLRSYQAAHLIRKRGRHCAITINDTRTTTILIMKFIQLEQHLFRK
jgi:hypothetical protein